ncbi:MAG TPA: ribonuclease III [Candidatus Baltobacteraceae bacterium]|nr:ribonuclease III [Candidatus Baltobacteraceae bacterium]
MAGERRRARLRALIDRAGVKADTVDRFEAAFIHDSAAAERDLTSNERLEFLGDAVLGLVTARWLYDGYADEDEGVLAKRKAAIVADSAIAATARRLGFEDLVDVGSGERAHGGARRASILGDAFEAFVAVLFREHGLEAAATFILQEHIAHMDVEQAARADAKTELQELTQARLQCTPQYHESHEGPAHARTFTSTVQVSGEVLGTGTGPSKKAAQQQAAAAALNALSERFGRTHATQEN